MRTQGGVTPPPGIFDGGAQPRPTIGGTQPELTIGGTQPDNIGGTQPDRV